MPIEVGSGQPLLLCFLLGPYLSQVQCNAIIIAVFMGKLGPDSVALGTSVLAEVA